VRCRNRLFTPNRRVRSFWHDHERYEPLGPSLQAALEEGGAARYQAARSVNDSGRWRKNEINTFFRSGQVNDDRRKQSCVDLGSRLHFLRIQLKSKVEAKKFVLRMGTHGAEGVTSATGYPTGVAGCRFMRAAKGEPLHYG
jgi:hypothetical protein